MVLSLSEIKTIIKTTIAKIIKILKQVNGPDAGENLKRENETKKEQDGEVEENEAEPLVTGALLNPLRQMTLRSTELVSERVHTCRLMIYNRSWPGLHISRRRTPSSQHVTTNINLKGECTPASIT